MSHATDTTLPDLVHEWVKEHPDQLFTPADVLRDLAPLSQEDAKRVSFILSYPVSALATALRGGVHRTRGKFGLTMFQDLAENGLFYRTAPGTYVYDTAARFTRPTGSRKARVVDNQWPIWLGSFATGNRTSAPPIPSILPAAAGRPVTPPVMIARATSESERNQQKIQRLNHVLEERVSEIDALKQQLSVLSSPEHPPALVPRRTQVTFTETLAVIETDTEVVVATILVRSPK